MRLVVIAFLLIGVAAVDECAELCRRDSRCVRGSWCKGDAVRGSCHNFFYDSADKSGGFHYHVHGMTSVHPVLCGEARGLLSRVPSGSSSVATPAPVRGGPRELDVVNVGVVSIDTSTVRPSHAPTTAAMSTPGSWIGLTCPALCESVAPCREAARGSYCKPNGTCSGLFFRTRERNDVCYHSLRSDCPDDFPVTCDTSSGITAVSSHSSASPVPSSVASTTRTPQTTSPHRSVRLERPAADTLIAQVDGRRFRSNSGELGVIIAFENPHLRLEFTYRGDRTIVEGLEYMIEGNFVHLQRGGPLRVLIETVETMSTAIMHHRHSAHHVTIHIVPAGTVQNDSTYVIVRLGDLPPVTCTAF